MIFILKADLESLNGTLRNSRLNREVFLKSLLEITMFSIEEVYLSFVHFTYFSGFVPPCLNVLKFCLQLLIVCFVRSELFSEVLNHLETGLAIFSSLL